MRRALGVLCVVLVLSGWTSCQPVTGGDDVGQMSTAGYAGLAAGEDWHYVGEAGEPAFENSWANVAGGPALGFRIREAGVVDVAGWVTTTPSMTGVDDTIFTLPAGYRPTNLSFFTVMGITATTGTVSVGQIHVSTAGIVNGYRSGATGHETIYMFGQFFLDSPVSTPP